MVVQHNRVVRSPTWQPELIALLLPQVVVLPTTVVVVNNQGGPSLTLPVNKQNVSCYGTSDGAITLAATGGTGQFAIQH
jgi:hypothetical protein